MRRPPVLFAALALAVTAGPLAAVERGFDASAEAAYDTNVTRGQLRDDIRADGYVSGYGGATLRWPFDDGSAASVGAALRGAQYLRFPRLSMLAAEASADWQRKVGLGLEAPWIAASALIAHESYLESARDSDRLALSLRAGKRFSERFDASLGYVFDRRYAHHDDPVVPGISGAVWDLSGQTGYLRAGYALTDRWQLDAGYALRRGDVVSTTHRNLTVFLASDAIAVSHAFGPGFFDYRLRGTTQTGDAALSYALGDRSSLNFAYAYAFTSAAHGFEYQNHLAIASWVYRY
jgi:hypothetical protein